MCVSAQVGCFDPYSDDPRLGIQKISLCKYSNKLVVAGTAGQVKALKPFASFFLIPRHKNEFLNASR